MERHKGFVQIKDCYFTNGQRELMDAFIQGKMAQMGFREVNQAAVKLLLFLIFNH